MRWFLSGSSRARRHTIHRTGQPHVPVIAALVVLLSIAPVHVAASLAQDVPPPQPVELECATGASVQVLSAAPVDQGARMLILGRLILKPGGGIGAHENLATTGVVVESGSFGFTLLDEAEVVVTRAATDDTEASQDSVVVGEETRLNPGDSYVPPIGVAHTGTNLSDGDTALLFAALAEAGQPLEVCVGTATPAAN